jgi:putative inorganic carbon (HCO3(-)) transporter
MTLVGATAVAAGLALMPGNSKALRAGAGIAAALCVFATLGTVSRGGMISLGVVLVLAAVLSGHGRRSGAVVLVVVIAAFAAVYVVAIAPNYVRDRITHNDGGSGRSDLWKIGWRVVQADPILGVGAGNFPIVSVHYVLRPGTITRSDLIVDEQKVAHNIYLEIPAELGIVGLLLFLAITGFALRCGIRASRRFAEAGDRDMELLALSIVLGAAGMLTANIFISEQFNKPLWLLLSIGPALLALANAELARSRAGTA